MNVMWGAREEQEMDNYLSQETICEEIVELTLKEGKQHEVFLSPASRQRCLLFPMSEGVMHSLHL